MSDDLMTCARCTRVPRDDEDRTSWVVLESEEVCPGCLTLTEAEELRKERP
jgi:hypothetical protein